MKTDIATKKEIIFLPNLKITRFCWGEEKRIDLIYDTAKIIPFNVLKNKMFNSHNILCKLWGSGNLDNS